MWYFGTHGDLHMTGPKPENGPDGLKKYDPEAYQLMDDFYSGRMKIPKVEPRRRFNREENRTVRSATNAPAAIQEQK